jgi:hypothetical protein
MVDVSEVAKSLRLVGLTEVDEAADLIEQQAARVTALESERDALLAAAGKEAGAIYQVQTSCNGWTDHSREEYEGARLPRRVVYTAPAAALALSQKAGEQQ